MKHLTKSEIGLDPEHYPQVNRWLQRGDGIAVYENQAFDSASLGHRKFVSFGSKDAQLEVDEPPQRLPDIGGQINWKYQLVGVYKGEELEQVKFDKKRFWERIQGDHAAELTDE